MAVIIIKKQIFLLNAFLTITNKTELKKQSPASKYAQTERNA